MDRISKVNFIGVAGVEDMGPLSLDPGTYVLGRSDKNDIVIKKNDISRQHARIEVADDRMTVTDLGSANGTRVNGQRLQAPVIVQDGDEVEFGDRKFRCQIVREEPVESAAEATALWTPATADVPVAIPPALAERPADATAIWEPPPKPAAAPAPPEPPAPKGKGKKAPPPKIQLETADVDVSVTAPTKKTQVPKKQRRSILFPLFVLLMIAVAGLLGVVLYVKMQQQARSADDDVEPTMMVEIDKPPDKLTANELAKMSKPDRAAYRKALYFFEVRNYGNARAALDLLAQKYPGNQAVERQRKKVDGAIKNEIALQMQRGQDGERFLKYPEALEAYRAVVRLAPPGGKERQEAEKRIQVLQAKIAEEQNKVE